MVDEQQTEVRQQTAVNGNERVDRQTVRTTQSVSSSVLAQRIVYYIGGAIMVILAARFVLLLLGASQASSFVNFVYSLSGVFVAPFNGIFTRPTYGTSTFDSATIVAIIVYGILTVAIAKLLTIGSRNRDLA
ncbi:MAG: Membrane protein involved in colicin uptake [Candidatus Saccharibacteria bacterium]|nr:Membrane protein involved in colicin uptake [Candidatus Saccharibacteria bacterium]